MSLAEHIEDGLRPEPFEDGDELRQRFVIDGPKTADWALRKLARAKGRQAENAALAAAEVERITEWLTAENAKLGHDVAFFEGLLTEYHRHVLDGEPDRRTIALPAGKLVARKQPDRWQFDTHEFVAWAVRAGRPELVRQPPPEVNKADAKRAFKLVDGQVLDAATGEKAEGVAVEVGDVRFSVEVTP